MMTYEVWLYGSRARGDADEMSDTDVLVIGDAPPVPGFVSELGLVEASTSFYSWQEVVAMWQYGSLFLQHLRDEGRLVRAWGSNPGRFRNLLATLPSFSRARQDLTVFRYAVAEAEESLREGGWPDVELSILATVARHAAILACHCIGQPRFGRTTPFEVWTAHARWTGADSRQLIEGSVAFRFTPLGDAEWIMLEGTARKWIDLVHRLLHEMEVDVARYEHSLPAAA